MRHRLAHLTLQYRFLSLGIILLITAFFTAGLARVELRTIFSDLFPKNHPFVETYKDHPNFGNPLTVTVMVKRKDGDIYNAETLAKVWRMTRDIDLAPAVDHDQILSITTEKARYAEATPYGIDIRPVMEDRAPETAEEIDEFRHRVDKSSNIRTFLISQDESATLIQATFIERLLDYGETFAFVQELVERERDENHEIHAAGQPMLTGWVYTYEVQMIGIFAVTLSLLLIALVLYMRNFLGVVTPLLVSIVAAIWGFGFVGWIGDPIEPLILVVPLLLIARSFSHTVQFLERYYEIYCEVPERKQAAELTLGVMMAPGVLGIITDAAGLFLIAIAPIPVMERFALFCGFWAAILVPTNLFFAPVLLTFFPAPRNAAKLAGKSHKNSAHARLIRMLEKVGGLNHGRRARSTTVVVVVVAIVGLALMSQIKVGNPVEGSNLLWEDSEFNTAVRELNAHFPGVMTLEVIFEGMEGERIAKMADTVDSMTTLQRFLESQPNPPTATLSIADYLPEANRLFSGGHPKWSPVDNNDAAVNAASSALFFGTSAKAYSHVTDFTLENATLSLWYKDNRQDTVDEALRQARAGLDIVGTEHEFFRIRLGTGAIALQQSVNDTVDRYQWLILSALNIVIFLTCSLAYRSFAAGVLLLIPVNLSNVLLMAVMYLMDIGLDVNSLPIAAIGIGIGIDYGIYLLSRICEEYRGRQEHGAAIERAVSTTGKAIFFTATIVLVAIMPWYFLSELKFLADMGLLLVMVMLINMVVALIVLPLLVWLFKPKFVEREHLIISEHTDVELLLEQGASA
jgi:predicted RND superfamily exporter protein